MLGFEDPKLLEALRKLGRGVWDLERMEHGEKMLMAFVTVALFLTKLLSSQVLSTSFTT